MRNLKSDGNSGDDRVMLKERLSSERGSVLVLVMFIVLLLTILGVGVLSATVGGARRAETRENDVQSLHLAQKKIDEVIAYMTERLNTMLATGIDKPQNQLNSEIQTFLSSLGSQTGDFKSATNLDGATNQITSITLDQSASSGSQYAIVIQANALVNGVSRNLEQRVTVTTFPDFLNYSLGSEGDVVLNGAPYIQGNVYAGGNLKLSPVAEYTHNGTDLTKNALYPLIIGETHVQSLKHIQYWNGAAHIEVPSGNESQYKMVDPRVKQAYENSLIKKNTTFVQIDVEDSFLDKVAEASGTVSNKGTYAGVYYGPGGPKPSDDPAELKERGSRLASSLLTDPTWPVLKMPQRSDYDGKKPEVDEDGTEQSLTEAELETWRESEYQAASQVFRNGMAGLSSSAIYNGSLYLGDTIKTITDITKAGNGSSGAQPSNWLIINGDLKIDSNDPRNPVNVQANLLVLGDLYIEGDVQFDSTLYTLGKSDIINASITGKDGKELVLISKGAILLNRVDEFKDHEHVTELKAFFYTDSTADLYGVGSIFNLNGGFFAKGTLTINAVVEKVREQPGQPEFIFDQQDTPATRDNPDTSRFIIHYNEAVFEHQKVGLPRVKQISIKAGPVKLKPQS